MTVAKAVYITGCRERWGPTVFVDLEEPEKIGENIVGGPHFVTEKIIILMSM